MILEFMTEWNKGANKNNPTLFREKIWAGLLDYGISTREEALFYSDNNRLFDVLGTYQPKLHTMRKEIVGRRSEISFVAGSDKHQFAPIIECVSVQDIKWRQFGNAKFPDIVVDGQHYSAHKHSGIINAIAINDGFESVEEFFAYFGMYFEGKIIHWTNLRY